MTNTKDLFLKKKFPDWIENHKVFKSNKQIKKIFPDIGLPNCEREIELDNSNEARASAINLISEINNELGRRSQKLNKFGAKEAIKASKKRQSKLDDINLLIQSVRNLILKQQNNFVIVNKGRITLNLPTDIFNSNKELVFKSGEGLIRVYNKLNETLREGKFLAMERIEALPAFKTFSASNLPVVKLKLRFSSSGEEGLWDIATMSMRGISSCQTWGNGNSTHLIGSMVDPFTGIIYLTSGAKHENYGSKMIRRCVVRFAVDDRNKRPFIFLEKMYPNHEESILKQFVNFIRERTNNRFPVRVGSIGNSYVPMADVVRQLPARNLPYRDSGVAYKTDTNDPYGMMKEQADEQLNRFFQILANKVMSVARSVKIGSIPEAYKEAFRAMRGSTYYYDYSGYISNDLANSARDKFKMNDLSKFQDLGAYLNVSVKNFVEKGVEDLIFSTMKSSCGKYIPPSLGKIEDKLLKSVAEIAANKVKSSFSEELNRLAKSKAGKIVKQEEQIYSKFLS
jgi:hypothetical protein